MPAPKKSKRLREEIDQGVDHSRQVRGSQRIALSDIRTDGGTQPRAALDTDTISEYADDMTEGAQFPPVTVYYDGETYWLADGFHRVAAATRIEVREIDAEILQGTHRQAVLHSVGVNATHGLRRTNADKRQAVMTLLRDDEWSQWSDREIARRCAVSDRFVNNLRRDLSANDSQMGQRERKVSRGGTTYTQNTGNIGKQPDPEPEPEEDSEPDIGEEPDIDEEPEPEFDDEEDVETPVNTRPDEAIEDIQQYISDVLSEFSDLTDKHYVVNETIKYLRKKSIDFNRSTDT
jgi:hypothetical protein